MMKLLDIKRARRGRKRAIAKAIAFAAYAIIWKTADVSAGNVVLPGELPAGEQLVAGQATVTRSGSSMDIVQTTDRAILNWQTFNIGAQAKVEFHQPDAHAVVLNRVLTSDPSGIYGALRSNGQVFLVNPSGIVFGKGASVNVGSLVASTMSIGDRDFLNGTYHFNRNGSIAGIVNHGNIVAADGGCVALFAPEVTSDGLISARLGSVMLASGEAITLGMGRDDLYIIAVDPSKVASAIENRGMIQADGGHVLMQASTAGELLGSVINNGGMVQARTAENRNGTIVLLGDMESGSVQVSGTLDASAPEGGDGGFIETSAAHVRIDDGTKVTTLATNGEAGTWLIDPHDFTIATGATGDISGATLQTALTAGNVTILSSQGSTASGSGDINVNDNVTWWNNTLTLTAAKNININAVLSVRDSNPGDAIDASDARLVMNTATANGSDAAVSGGTVLVGLTSSGFTGRVDFDRSGTAVLTINSAGYNIINSRSALQGMVSGNSNVRYVLGSNISADSFTPIGTNSTPFKGVLDGLGHTIDNLTVNTSTDNVGLFGVTNSASIRNIGITNVNLQGGNKVGAVVGYAQSTSILNSWSSGIIHLNYSYAGGLVGSATNTVIEKSYSTAAVSSSDPADLFTYYTGGLVGYMQANSSIRQSYSSGNTTGGISVGGIAGYMIDSTITSTYSNADEILGTKTTGGIVGNMQSSSISDSEFRGNKVTQRDTQYASDCGGLAGYAETSTISQSTSKGIVYGKGSSNGGLVGYLYACTVNNSSSSALVYATLYGGGLVGKIDNGSIITSSMATGNVIGINNYNNSSSQYYLGGLIGFVNVRNGVSYQFSDSFTSGNVTASSTSQYVGGLIGGMNIEVGAQATCTIRNVGASGSVEGGRYIGGLIGNNYFEINQASSSGSVTGTGDYVGGLVGYNEVVSGVTHSGNITSSYHKNNLSGTTGTVRGVNYVGGLVGYSTGGTLSDSNNESDVVGTRFAGGLFGAAFNMIITNVSVSCNVQATQYVGGLAGIGSGSISDSFFSGTVTGDSYLGGIGGSLSSALSKVSSSAEIHGKTFSTFVGGIAGAYSTSSGMDDVHFTGSFASAMQAHVGGLIGQANDIISINNSSSTADVAGTQTSECIGGLIGSFQAVSRTGSSITNSYSTGAVSGNVDVGGLIGCAEQGGTLSGSWSEGNVNGVGASQQNIGGLVGSSIAAALLNSSPSDTLLIMDSYSTGSVSSTGIYVGGLVGYNEGRIDSSYSTGGVSSTGNYVGGLVGFNVPVNDLTGSGTITGSYHSSGFSVQGGNYVGGLVGHSFGGSITDSYNESSVVGSQYVGGLAGRLSGSMVLGTGSNTTYNSGTVTGTKDVGGLVGTLVNSSSIVNALNTGTFTITGSAQNNIGGLAGSVTSSSIANSSSTVSILASETDSINVGGLIGSIDSGTVSGITFTGSEVHGWQYVGGLIGWDRLTNLVSMENASAVYGSQDVGGLVGYLERCSISDAHNTGGVSGVGALGGLVGSSRGVEISNTWNSGNVTTLTGSTSASIGGLVGSISSFDYGLSTITNSHSSGNVITTVSTVATSVGGLVGSSSAKILDCYSTGSVSSGTIGISVGGIVGSNSSNTVVAESGNITNSYHLTGSVVGGRMYTGGLVGNSSGGTFTNCYNTSAVSGTQYVGGLVGRNSGSGSAIRGSFSTGSVVADNTVGGLVGLNSSVADISNSYSWSTVRATNASDAKAGGLVGSNASGATIQNSYSTGSVTAAGGNAGGLVGMADDPSHVIRSFWDNQTSGWTTSAAGTGLSTAQMKSFGTFIDSSVAWDISKSYGEDKIWRIYDTDSYPLLHWYLIPLSGPYVVDSVTKTYDGSSFTGGTVSPALPAYAASDVFFGGSAQGARNANTQPYAITLWSNIYDLNVTNGTLTIDPKVLTISGSREYDGTTRFTSGNLSLNVSELVSGDATPVIVGYADVSSKNVGMYNSWSSSNLTLNDMNYTLSGGSVSARIDPKVLTISGSREYDGTTDFAGSVFGTVNGVTVGGMTETLTVSGKGTVSDRNVYSSSGSYNGAQTLLTSSSGTVVGLSLVGGIGVSASNYRLVGGTGEIRAKGVTLTGVSAADKEYDGTRTATLTGYTLTGLVGSETLGVSGYTALYDTKDAGTDKTVTVSGMTFTDVTGGGSVKNYTIDAPEVTTYAHIYPKALTITANDSQKFYDGVPYAGGNGVRYSGFVPGEDASVLDGSLVYRGSSQGAVAAGVYTITPYGMSSGNYDISYVSGVLNIITNEESYVYVTFDDDRNIWHSVEMIPSMGVKYEPMIVPGFVCVRDQDPIAMQ